MSSESAVVLAEGGSLDHVAFDVGRSSMELAAGARRFRFTGIHASTVLGPWDGTPAMLEFLCRVHQDERFGYYELRVHFGHVPRTYRIVAQRCEELARATEHRDRF